MNIDKLKIEAVKFFQDLQKQICDEISNIESEYGNGDRFIYNDWLRGENGGGGKSSVLKGVVMEKMGVNFSEVYGTFAEEHAKEIIGTDKAVPFWASGVSLVSHPRNPFISPIHMNVRMINAGEKSWFGGGIDLNPIYKNDQESLYFHQKLKEVCNKHDSEYYEKFSKWCDEYFYIKHRKENRGIGGIFFDYIECSEKNFNFLKDVGQNFLPIYTKIVKDNVLKEFSKENIEYQLHRRGRYAEFNLIYDRGIKFGLMTGGNPDSMMMSLPPLCSW
jgi:coproporphyrinogen III oxidase